MENNLGTVFEFLKGVGILGFIVWLIQQVIQKTSTASAAKTELSIIKERSEELKGKITTLNKENLDLNSELKKFTDYNTIIEKYDHDPVTDVLIRKVDGKIFCKTCLFKNTKEIPLKDNGITYCSICKIGSG